MLQNDGVPPVWKVDHRLLSFDRILCHCLQRISISEWWLPPIHIYDDWWTCIHHHVMIHNRPTESSAVPYKCIPRLGQNSRNFIYYSRNFLQISLNLRRPTAMGWVESSQRDCWLIAKAAARARLQKVQQAEIDQVMCLLIPPRSLNVPAPSRVFCPAIPCSP